MIGSGLKKLAKENGMQVAHGVGYGNFRGYAATLSEGSGYKQIVFATKLADKEALMAELNGVNVQRLYRVQNLNIAPNAIQIVFLDNPGTMKKIQEFLDWFLPLLQQHGATPWNICTECGCEIVSGRWLLVDGVAYYLHDSCRQKVHRDLEESEEAKKLKAKGSYASGTLGAFLGAAVGAIAWAIVLSLGYMAPLVGFVIGWLSNFGYNLLKGKQGKGKIAILIVAIIFGVLLGTFAADAYAIYTMIQDGTLAGLSIADIPTVIIALLVGDGEYRAATLGNIIMGLLFAGLGVFSLLSKASKQVSGTKIVDLD